MNLKMVKRLGTGVLSLGVALSLAACGSGGATGGGSAGGAEGQTAELRLTHTNPSSTAMGVASETFAELISEKTEGRYNITVYHDAQLGDERDSVEGVQLGNIDFALVNASVLVNFAPELKVFDLPYVIQSTEHADAVFMGEIGDEAMGWVDQIGVKAFGVWESGFRNLTNSVRPVESVDDVAGLRIRVMENELHQKFWLALGADPVPMAWGEAYTALQQGALDGQENPTNVILSNNIQEVNENLALTEHIYSIVIPIMSQKVWDGLSDADKALFQEAFDEMMEKEREIVRAQNDEALSELEAGGMQVTRPDKSGFIEKTREVRETEGAQYSDTLSKIEELA